MKHITSQDVEFFRFKLLTQTQGIVYAFSFLLSDNGVDTDLIMEIVLNFDIPGLGVEHAYRAAKNIINAKDELTQ